MEQDECQQRSSSRGHVTAPSSTPPFRDGLSLLRDGAFGELTVETQAAPAAGAANVELLQLAERVRALEALLVTGNHKLQPGTPLGAGAVRGYRPAYGSISSPPCTGFDILFHTPRNYYHRPGVSGPLAQGAQSSDGKRPGTPPLPPEPPSPPAVVIPPNDEFRPRPLRRANGNPSPPPLDANGANGANGGGGGASNGSGAAGDASHHGAHHLTASDLPSSGGEGSISPIRSCASSPQQQEPRRRRRQFGGADSEPRAHDTVVGPGEPPDLHGGSAHGGGGDGANGGGYGGGSIYGGGGNGAKAASDSGGSVAGSCRSRTGGGLSLEPLSERGNGLWRMSLLDYIRVEVLGAEDHGSVDTNVNKTVKNFLAVPRQLERLLLFGMIICLDTFLYVTTFLPLRIAHGAAMAVVAVATRHARGRLTRSALYDAMRGALMVLSLVVLQNVDMSRVYHYIRGQAMIKLYVLIAMIEIFDKLMCSFGQDALDSLYWSARNSRKRRVFLHFAVVAVYAVLHSLLLFVHITTLTVAVNSDDQALLALLISNNFAEIKGSVFKKFDKQNLFQLSCHDIVERFKLMLFLVMIMLLNVVHGGSEDVFGQFVNVFLLVFGGEVLADWIKHAFITKFNQLQPTLYEEYSTILAKDLTSCRKEDSAILDHTHFVARRLAFSTVPLNCVMIRFMQIAAPRVWLYMPHCSRAMTACLGALAYLVLLSLKVLTGIVLMAHSYALHPDVVVQNTPGHPWQRSPTVGLHKTKKELSLEKLSTIERFTLWKGRIV